MLSDCVKKVIFWVSPVTFVLFGFQNLEAMRSISLFQAVGVAADAKPDSIHLSGFSAGILEGSSTLLIIIPELLCVQLIPVRKLCLRNKHMVAILLTKKAFLNLFVNYALEFWCWLLFCFFSSPYVNDIWFEGKSFWWENYLVYCILTAGIQVCVKLQGIWKWIPWSTHSKNSICWKSVRHRAYFRIQESILYIQDVVYQKGCPLYIVAVAKCNELGMRHSGPVPCSQSLIPVPINDG